MKKIMLVALVLISAVTFAQKGRGHHQDPKERATKSADRMKKELLLSDDQYGKVKTLNEKYSERYAAVRKDTSLTRGRTMNRMKSIRSEQETELKKILTPDQATKWDALKAKRQEERKNHHHRHGGRPDRDQGNG